MKALKFANLLVIALVLTVAAAGCKKKPTGVTKLPPGQTGIVGEGGPSGLDDGGTASGFESGPTPLSPPGTFDGMTEDRAALADYIVFFGFDSSLVQASEDGKVVSVAGILNENLSNAVRIEGHCDERGTEGYNLALGERRALSLREALIAAGVDANRIDTISYGEERPLDPGHDEFAWSQNRRGEFILLLP